MSIIPILIFQVNKIIFLSINNVIKKYIKAMACGCKNKQNAAAQSKPAAQKPSNPLNNGSVGGRRIEKRIIR